MSDNGNRYLVYVDGQPLNPHQPLTADEAAQHFRDQDELADDGEQVEVRAFTDDSPATTAR
jgi:hypothetical protein